MKTKEGFGRLLPEGLDCELVKFTNPGHCAIRLLCNGMIYHGSLDDLSYTQETHWADGGKSADVYYK